MLEVSSLLIIIFILIFLMTIYFFGRKDGYQKGVDEGYKRATNEYEKVLDEIDSRGFKRDYYGN